LSAQDVFDLKERGSPSHSHVLWAANRNGATRIDLDNDFRCEAVPESVMVPEPISRLVFDKSGRLYLFGKHGVVRLTPDTGAPDDLGRLHAEHFGLDDGLPTLEFNRGAFVDDQGRIWAASVEGAVLYDPREEMAAHTPRPFRMLSARVDGTQKQLLDNAVLDADENNLAFDFSLLSFQRDKLTRYRTELTGLDEPITEWTPDNRRVFRRLPAGDYAFHAYARDGFGLESEPISMRFSISHPMWRRWWAIVLYGFAVIALSATISRWRIDRIRRASKVLEQTVKERTASLVVANRQLEEARKTAEAATQSKSVFLANMSHEIRTPMNAVLGFAGLGLRLGLSAKAHDYFRKINNAGQNLLNILNDILDFSKIEAGKLALETVPFALSDVLSHVTDLFTLKASEKNLEFVVGTAPGVSDHFVGDPLRLGQVLLNLVNNAIKFTQAGFVQLYVEHVQNASRNGKTVLRFSVEDSGIGMSTEQMEKLFQPFSQADHSTTRNFGGTGLGLTISQRLVAQMGGVISVTSHRGAGSCFHFEIGLKHQENPVELLRLIPEQLIGLKILVVDDSSQAREWLRDQLTALRFDVATADSGEVALERLRREKFSLIMMDWMMPGIDGIETTRRIRSDIALEQIPEVIMVTAHGREAIQEAAEAVGVRRFLIKPVNPSVLFDTIVETLGANPQRAEERPKEPLQTIQAFQGVRVLLTEDNQINQALAIDMLASAGIKTDVANNGLEALKLAGASAYDAILMDIEMPEMDGYTAARKIREHMGDAAPPIIAMTAHASQDHRQRCLDAGMADFITKPILFDELLAMLKKWVTRVAAAVPKSGTSAPTTSAPTSKEIDVRTALARMNGNAGLLKKLLIMFPDSHSYSHSELCAALETDDAKTASRIAHSVAGAAGNIGATRLHAVGHELEDAIARGDAEKTDVLLPQFSASLKATIACCTELAAQL
jgi:signal transduction histidine kinase/CheY-like chemotaxis protein/HPt (histidine-containing phosphotransfer) domain-containing protein